jgi:hypothetical protein
MRTTTRGSAKMLLGPTTKLRILHILTVLLATYLKEGGIRANR